MQIVTVTTYATNTSFFSQVSYKDGRRPQNCWFNVLHLTEEKTSSPLDTQAILLESINIYYFSVLCLFGAHLIYFYCPSPIDPDITGIKKLFREASKCYVKPEACHREFQFLLTYTKMLEGGFRFFFPNYHF